MAQHPFVEIEKDCTKVVSERRLLAEQHGLRLSAAEVLSGRCWGSGHLVAACCGRRKKRQAREGPAGTRPYQQKLLDRVSAWKAFPGPTPDAAANNK
jgi:hypothetical protein